MGLRRRALPTAVHRLDNRVLRELKMEELLKWMGYLTPTELQLLQQL